MASFYRSTVGEFLILSLEQALARLSIAYAARGYTSQYTDQTLTWERDLQHLRSVLSQCTSALPQASKWGIILEFSIPRKEMRIDVVLLIGHTVVLLETKSHDSTAQARRQIEEYALLLHYFHGGTSKKWITPILVSSDKRESHTQPLRQYEMFPQLAIYWIAPVRTISWDSLAQILSGFAAYSSDPLDVMDWDESPYHPVPSIIGAAMALRTGLDIREIAHSEASEHEIQIVLDTIQGFVNSARSNRQHAICFLTGVPGSGKTLVGLSLAHADENKSNAIHFMSGNGPLVKVLQHLFTMESRKSGASVAQARTEARTLIENVHVFARYHTDDNQGPPFNHAIIFDEAQRAWNRAQNKKKFNRDYSEPEMLLRIMERHDDWAAVIALVGGGQEINDGEAGLEEWGKALSECAKDWLVYASPEVLNGGPSTAGHRLFDNPASSRSIITSPALHLRTSNRSLRAENLATWVNHVIDGNAEGAIELRITEKFPIFLSRSLEEVRCELKKQGIGLNRFGLIGSSGAARLRADGLESNSTFHADYPWEHWYLAERADVRSSFQCEVFATEFEIQGLELDWIGLCWGGDFVWDDSVGWQLRSFRPGANNRWLRIKNPDKQTFRRNAYRVLLTRARQGMIIFIPQGCSEDPSRPPHEFDQTARYLLKCGVTPLPSAKTSEGANYSEQEAPLFAGN